MNEFTTLLAAAGQRVGEIPLAAVRRIERAGTRVIVHLRDGSQLLLDESILFPDLAVLPDWIAPDGLNLVRRSAIERVRPAPGFDLFQVLLDTGEVWWVSGAYGVALAGAWVANVERRFEGHPLDAGSLMPWPPEIPAPKPGPMSDDFRKLFSDRRPGAYLSLP
jgi:hypothetical protein